MSQLIQASQDANTGKVQPFNEAALKFIMDDVDFTEVPPELFAASLPPPAQLARAQSDDASPSLQKRASKASSLFSWGEGTGSPKGSAYPLSGKTAAEEHQLAKIVIEDDVSDEEPESPTYAQMGFHKADMSPKTTTQQLSLEQPLADKSDQIYELDLDTLLERLKKLEKADATLDKYEQATLTQQRKDYVTQKAQGLEGMRFKKDLNYNVYPAVCVFGKDGSEDWFTPFRPMQESVPACGSGLCAGTCNTCMPVLKGTTFTGRAVAPSMDALEDCGIFD